MIDAVRIARAIEPWYWPVFLTFEAILMGGVVAGSHRLIVVGLGGLMGCCVLLMCLGCFLTMDQID